MLHIPTISELLSKGETPDVLFWVGCAGSFDDKAQKVTQSFAKILNTININYAILGLEESCSGDPARRAGNEFLFQLQAHSNIALFKKYKVTEVITTCPHCFNIFKNEYPDLGAKFEVYHHTEYLYYLFDSGKLNIEKGYFKGQKITFHDPCYLGRSNGVYEAPRELLKILDFDLIEMKRSKSSSLCCGAGGSQMFKEPERGDKDINIERTEEALSLNPSIIATGCPFCKTMLVDGLKNKEKENDVQVLDIAELIFQAKQLS